MKWIQHFIGAASFDSVYPRAAKRIEWQPGSVCVKARSDTHALLSVQKNPSLLVQKDVMHIPTVVRTRGRVQPLR